MMLLQYLSFLSYYVMPCVVVDVLFFFLDILLCFLCKASSPKGNKGFIYSFKEDFLSS